MLLVEHLLDFIKEVSAFCVVLVACCAVKLFDKLFLLAVKILRNFNGNSYILVASASAAKSLNTLALESENITRLCTLTNRVGNLAVKSRNNNICSESRLCKGYRNFAPHIVTSAFKNRVRTNIYINMKVACRTAVVMSEMHTNTDAMPSKNSSVGPAALLRG